MPSLTALFRILPTGFLGALLAAQTLATGSIYPAILWHFLNNGMAVLIDRFELLQNANPTAVNVASIALLLLSGALVWHFRTPYPKPAPTVASPGESEVHHERAA